MTDNRSPLPYRLNSECAVVFSSCDHDPEQSYFCGYYYPSPLKSGRLLCHRTAFDGRNITEADSCEIGYWDTATRHFVVCGRTFAFNWQQGAMLQWLPEGRSFIYNNREGNRFVAEIGDVRDGSVRRLASPVYVVHPSGRFALAANFEHLAFCREGYNYQGVRNKRWDVFIDPQDGISRVDLETGETRLIVSTADVAAIRAKVDMRGCYHWLEHMIWNPSGTRFAFLHRWAPGDPSGAGHRTRLFTADASGQSLFMFPDTGFYSHMNWRADDVFTVWGMIPEGLLPQVLAPASAVRRVLRPLYHRVRRFLPPMIARRNQAFQAFLSYKDVSRDWEVAGQGILDRNGHNTWSADGSYMLTDTYADENHYRHLALYDSLRHELIPIGRFYSPFNDSVFRCDLHPRFGEEEGQVIVDSAHAGRRHVYMIDITKLLKDRSS